MPTLTLNPGFVLLAAALLALATPRAVRPFVIAASALTALWLLLDNEFGAAAAMAQMGLPVVLLDLDELNRVFGIALLIALVVIAIATSARRNRFEDAAILLMAGGAVTALFVGDLISFVAAAAVSGLGASWTVFVSPVEGSSPAGARLLIWHGLEGLLFLVGVALHLTAGAERSMLSRMDAHGMSGAFILAGLLIRVGAPFTHVWLKDAIGHASPVGSAALSAFSSMLGVYALARFFAAEQVLVFVGAGMMLVGAFYAAAETDLKRATGYALTAQSGVCVALIGIGSPLALAAAEAHAFASIAAFVALQLALGGIQVRRTHVRISALAGGGRSMPFTTLFVLLGGLAVSAAPGFASYASFALALEASSTWETRALWALIAALSGVLFSALAVRPFLAANNAPAEGPTQLHEAPYALLLATIVGIFFCVAVGLAPSWLYGLLPGELSFQPFAADRVAHQLQVIGLAGAAYVLLAPTRRGADVRSLPDVDALYAGPLAKAGRAGIGGLLALQAHLDRWAHRYWQVIHERFAGWVRATDRPYAGGRDGVLWVSLTAIVVCAAFIARQGW